MKNFFKNYDWGWIFSVSAMVCVGIVLLACPIPAARVCGIVSGVLFVLGGLSGLVGSFLFDSKNAFHLLAGVTQLAIAVWLFASGLFDSTSTIIWVFCLGLGVMVILFAAGGVYEAVMARKRDKFWILRILLSGLVIAFSVVVMVDPFAMLRHLTYAAGALLLAAGAAEVFAMVRSGVTHPSTKENKDGTVRGARDLREQDGSRK